MTRKSDIERLEKRIERAEGVAHTEGERPPDLTDEERAMLDEMFGVEPFSDNDTDTDLGE